MAVNFYQLRIFFAVAEKGSFSAAASGMRISQPAVTMQIQSLENYFGTKLFNRSTRRIVLTEAGEALLPFAKRAIHLMKETDQAMTHYIQSLQGQIELGASLTFGEYLLPRILGPFSKEYPNISVSMKVIDTTQILDEILAHQLTFGLVETSIDHPDVLVEPLFYDELKLIVPTGHPLAQMAQPHIEQVLEYPFILREKGSSTRLVMEEEFRRHQLDLSQIKIASELGSTGAVKSAVEAGLGISILSQSAVKHELSLRLLEMKSIAGFEFKRHFFSVYLNSMLLPLSAVTFLTFLQQRDLSQWL